MNLFFKNYIKIHGNTLMGYLSQKIYFTKFRYVFKAQMAIMLRGIMLENGLELNLPFWPISKLNKTNPNLIF